ncbi:MAG: acetolactate synthase [Clostridia bacterium]|nr:acetolactate synthase [Clostridia bacterium]
MSIKQLSVFVENKFGRVSDICNVLAENHINMSALSIADTSEFGVARIIVDKPEEAKKVLSQSGVIVKVTDVIGVAIDDKPGGLAAVLDLLKEGKVSVEYMYAFLPKMRDHAMVVMKVDKPDVAQAVFKTNSVHMAETADIQ